MTEQSFSIDGLKCEGCVETVTNALSALQPVHDVSIDLNANGTSTVRLSTDVELTRDEIQAALKSEGDFSVVG
ncbi:heavy-metal-associated domain-containing protein [Mycobacterium bourgelatii]|uniref:HMA domain-containing protein n=1 Tax=Mycobacterium bourgelatii TaxID=1273442 RepID=A0A7I9YZB5_MYCBU|nr:heavy metal-associated domain-containing protein [Mycobacterium bourgelatii]MCV6976500.1 heavy-metal-associated domain-containing protein [Mycobacterium bourgelatii]GFG93948.1 hypothetical protein MBOU_59900 [Mycobacterium bourgelatii]